MKTNKKIWKLLFTFPKVKAAHAQHYVGVEASDLGSALRKGFKEIKAKPQLKGARIREGKVTFSVEELDEQF